MVARQRLDQPGAITGIARRLRSSESRASLGFSSITRGGIRVESAEGIRVNTVPGGQPGMRVTGLQLVDGTLRVTGRLEGGGTFVWTGTLTNNGPLIQNGEWHLNGDGDISGDADITGILTLLSELIVEAAGRITVKGTDGDLVLTDSLITMPNGGTITGTANGVIIKYGDSQVRLTGSQAWLTGDGSSVVLSSAGARFSNLPVASSLTDLSWLAVDLTGRVWKVAQSTGGPMSGPLRWPFPQSFVTSEYGPRESPGPGGSTFHDGIDLAPGEGTPIPAAGSGTVELAGVNGGFGNCVIINHGGGLKTLYGHMQTTPSVSVGDTVSAGQIIGLVGNTGTSFGAHLHLEVWVNGTPVNPRTKLAN